MRIAGGPYRAYCAHPNTQESGCLRVVRRSTSVRLQASEATFELLTLRADAQDDGCQMPSEESDRAAVLTVDSVQAQSSSQTAVASCVCLLAVDFKHHGLRVAWSCMPSHRTGYRHCLSYTIPHASDKHEEREGQYTAFMSFVNSH